MQVYLDESGDLGWTFSAPYRAGGSSRYLCLAFLIIPKSLKKHPSDIIRDMYRKYGWVTEKKSSSASETQKIEFANAAQKLCRDHPEIQIDCIVAKKENVLSHIRCDPNKLYNYMCKLVVMDHVSSGKDFDFIPDKRSIKVECGSSLSDYLQTVIWFDAGSKSKLRNMPGQSDKIYNLQFVDWIAHCVWSHFEDGKKAPFQILEKSIRVRRLYFSN